MKPLRLFLKSSSIALLCMLAFSCVDQAYDTTKISTKAEILENGMDLPIGTLEVTMDSIFKGLDSTVLKVKGGVYTFCIPGNMDMSTVNSALSGFTPAAIPSPAPTTVNLIDASSYTVPYTVPTTFDQTPSNNAVVALPDFKTTMMNPVDSILLANTSFTMRATTSSNLGGTDKNGSIQITCIPVGNVAEYYDMTTKAKLSSWTMSANTDKQVGIRILKPALGNSLQITCQARVHPTSNGALTITTKAMTTISVSVTFSAVDFQTVYGKVIYSKTDNKTEDFDGFGALAANNSVLSFYDPTLKMCTNSNLGVPIKLNLTMSTKNSTTNITQSLAGTNFTMLPAANPSSTRSNVFTIDQPHNNLSNLFKINPDKVTLGYSIQADPNTSNHFINKNTFLTIVDTLEIPLKFGSDFVINMGDTIDNPFIDVVDQLGDQENLSFGFLLNITNRIPLSMMLKMTAIDSLGVSKFVISSGTIRGGDQIDPSTGFATDTAFTSTELSFSRPQINQFKDIRKFKVEFVVSASQGSGFVAIRPSDWIKIQVAGRISGGVILKDSSK